MIEKQSTFLAWLFRMPLIKRWSLMYCVKPENVAEHSHQVAIVAHLLAVIKNTKYKGNLNADRVATTALYHEASETRYGDVVSPTKYANKEIAHEFKKIEKLAEQECLATLPEELMPIFEQLIIQESVPEEISKIVKAADIIVAYLKSLDELQHQNHEFDHVKVKLDKKLTVLREEMPEVCYFLSTFVEACSNTIDKLTANK